MSGLGEKKVMSKVQKIQYRALTTQYFSAVIELANKVHGDGYLDDKKIDLVLSSDNDSLNTGKPLKGKSRTKASRKSTKQALEQERIANKGSNSQDKKKTKTKTKKSEKSKVKKRSARKKRPGKNARKATK